MKNIATSKVIIFGVGLRLSHWKKLSNLIQFELIPSEIDFEFVFFQKNWEKHEEEGIQKLFQLKPDLIITSACSFSHFESFERFVTLTSKSKSSFNPHFFLLEKDLDRFFLEYFNKNLYPLFCFSNIGYIRLSRPSQIFIKDDSLYIRHEVKPTPVIELPPQIESLRDQTKNINFWPWDEIEAVIWKGKKYPTTGFIDLITGEIERELKEHELSGLLVVNERTYLISGFHHRDILSFETEDMTIHGISTHLSLKKNHPGLIANLSRIAEFIKRVYADKFLKIIFNQNSLIKNNIPVTVLSQYQFVSKIIKFHLEQEGYHQVSVYGQDLTQSERILINLTSEKIQDRSLHLSLPIQKGVEIFKEFTSLLEEPVDFQIPPLKPLDSVFLKKQKSELISKRNRYKERLKTAKSVQVFKSHEDLQVQNAEKNLALLRELINKAELWDQSKNEIINRTDEKALIIYTDKLHATLMNHQLNKIPKKILLDISKIDSQDKLVSFQPTYLKDFSQNGFILINHSCKNSILENLTRLESELGGKYNPIVNNNIAKIKDEIQMIDQELNQLTYYEFWDQTADFFKKNLSSINELAIKRHSSIKKRLLSLSPSKKIGICTTQAGLSKQISKALIRISNSIDPNMIEEFSLSLDLIQKLPDDQVKQINRKYSSKIKRNLETQHELARQNVPLIAKYFETATTRLNSVFADLLILEMDIDLLTHLIKLLRTEESLYQFTPIIALFNGFLSRGKLELLAKQNIDLHFLEIQSLRDPQYLSELMKRVFPS
ncbi:MAG: hypothetical protein OEY59_06020 [Deltaproteobacteria bacterium]|nr:hypothetical protein [Deltaproteobacteria bacterium]